VTFSKLIWLPVKQLVEIVYMVLKRRLSLLYYCNIHSFMLRVESGFAM